MHKLFRQFPELQSSLQGVTEMQRSMGRNFADQENPTLREHPREIMFKSTHRLQELSRSSLGEFCAPMDEMRKVLMRSRGSKMSGSGSGPSSSSRAADRAEDSLGQVGDCANYTGALGEQPQTQVGMDNNEPGPLSVARVKLAKASLSFNPNGPVNVLRGFQGMALTIEEFDSLLRRGLNIILLKRELHALFNSMDADLSGYIDGVEFTRYFLQTGVDERKRHNMEQLRITWKAEEDEKDRAEREAERLRAWQERQVGSFTPADAASVYAKLEQVALNWDSSSDINELKLRGFDMFLSPFDFKTQLNRSFGLRLTGPECGALLKRFITRDSEKACVCGTDFLKFFIRLRKETKLNHKLVLVGLAARKQRVKNMGQQEVASRHLGR